MISFGRIDVEALQHELSVQRRQNAEQRRQIGQLIERTAEFVRADA